MKFSDLILMCLRNLTRRKFRTFLTVSGVVIGTTSIVVMISLGVGISASFDEMLQSWGDLTILTVYMQSSETPINDDSVAQMQAMPGVVVASPTMQFNPNNGWQLMTGRKDRYTTWPNLQGVLPEALPGLGYAVGEGEMKLGSDNKHIYILMGPMTAYDFWDSKSRGRNSYRNGWPDENGNVEDPFFDPLEADYTLRLNYYKEGAKDLEYSVKASGLLANKDGEWELMYGMFIAIDDLKRIRAEYERENKIVKDRDEVDSYEYVKVKVDSIESVPEVQHSIEQMGFYVRSMEEQRQNVEQSTQQIQTILGILGGVSLFVAAISITNTMIMSVYERTREIGVMKVLGCLVSNIRTVFLLEAGLIGFFGGCIGVGISFLLSHLFNKYGGSLGDSLMGMGEGAKLSIIPPWLVLTGLGVATLIGLMAGFYPANRAVRISALEAIKQE